MSFKNLYRIATGIALTLSVATSYGAPVLIPSPPQISASSYILMEASTGRIIAEQDADKKLPPASLTKMMTAYIAEKELAENRISFDDEVRVSIKAWKTGGSRMFIQEGTNVRVEDLLKGVIIQSGNDASVALAEFIAGSEDAFVDIMNQQAEILGMKNTRFDSASGLPRKEQYSSSRDLAILASHIINDYPENYPLYAQKSFTFGDITQLNRNRLLSRDSRIDGLKTGYTVKAKYGLVASGKENNTRFIAVIMGARSPESRAVEAQKLLSFGFRYYETLDFNRPGDILDTRKVWKGQDNTVGATVPESIRLTIPKGMKDDLEVSLHFDDVIKAPVEAGSLIGELTISSTEQELARSSLIANKSVEKAGFFKSLWHSIVLIFSAIFG